MFKPKLQQHQKELLLELLHLMAKIDGELTEKELIWIGKVRKYYKVKDYEEKGYTKENIRFFLEQMAEPDVLNILTHAFILALEDEEFSPEEQDLILSYFDLLSLESAGKMQRFIDRHANQTFDVKELFQLDQSEEEVLEESMKLLDEYSDSDVEDIDESALLKMNKGPVKKVWDQVLLLWETVKNPQTEKALKALGIGALLYLIAPIDAIPDFIPALGLTDDVAVIAYAMSKIYKSKKK
jgi:hypothetical protein